MPVPVHPPPPAHTRPPFASNAPLPHPHSRSRSRSSSSSLSPSMSKRSGTSKPKGAVRAKSGCYTCRIRRKKCDENPDADGSCQTCVRLHIQCLGFGAKRPEWMREGNSVVELRGKIKGFLAQNGMIKGHSSAAAAAASAVPSIATASAAAASSSGANLPAGIASPSASSSFADLAGPDSPPPPSIPSLAGAHHALRSASASSASPPSPARPELAPLQGSSASAGAGVLVLSHEHRAPPPPLSSSAPQLGGGGAAAHVHSHGPAALRGGYAHAHTTPYLGITSSGAALELQLDPRHAHAHAAHNFDHPMDTHAHAGAGAYAPGPASTRRSPSPSSSRRRTVDLLGRAVSAASASSSLSSSSSSSPSYALAFPSPAPAAAPSSSPSSAASSSSSSPPIPPFHALPYPRAADGAGFSSAHVYGYNNNNNNEYNEYTDCSDGFVPTPHSAPLNLSPDLVKTESMDLDLWRPDLLSPRADAPALALAFPSSGYDYTSYNNYNNTDNAPSPRWSPVVDNSPNAARRVAVAGVDVDYDPDDAYTYDAHGFRRLRRPHTVALARTRYNNDDPGYPTTAANANANANDNSFSTYGVYASAPPVGHPHSPYAVVPELSPDSPTPARSNGMVLPNVMLGGYAPHAHQQQALHAHGGGGLGHHGHGHGAQQNAYSLHAVGGHHGGGGGGHNGHNAHGNSGQASSSSSWNNHVRTSAELAHQQTYQQQHQQHQQTQQMLHEQYLLHYPYGPENKGIERRNVNHTNESGALSYPNASPTVRMPSLPPPLHSSFSRHYTADVVAGYDMEMDSDMEGQFAGVNVTTNGIGEGALLPFYDQQAPADLHSYNMYDLSEQQQYHQQQQFLSLPAPLVDPLFADRRDGDLVHHYMLHVRPVQYFFADSRVDELLLHLARDVPTLRDAMCFVASVHQRRMREGGSASSGSSQGSATPSPARAPLQLPAGTSGAPEADDRGATYHVRAKNALVHRADAALSKGEAMAGLQCVSSFLFAGGVGEWDWFLEVAVRWVQAKVLAPAAAAEGGAREWLARMAREDEMAGWIVRITMWFEVLASVTQVRPPRFLDAYRDVFGCASARVVEVDANPAINGGAEADFSMLTVMGCDNRTFVALAEISALAAWKEEQTKRQKLSSVELVRRGFAIEEKYLLRTMDAEGDLPRTAVVPAGTTYSYTDDADSLENRRRLTADIFRASARLYLHTVLSGDKPSVSEIADGVRETVEALERVPSAPASLRRSVVRSVVFPICLAGCMTDDAGQRGTLKQVLESEGGAGNCGEVVKVMEAVWRLRREGAVAGRRGGGENVVADVSWRDVLRKQGLPLLLV